jgi:hypothetical protein
MALRPEYDIIDTMLNQVKRWITINQEAWASTLDAVKEYSLDSEKFSLNHFGIHSRITSL